MRIDAPSVFAAWSRLGDRLARSHASLLGPRGPLRRWMHDELGRPGRLLGEPVVQHKFGFRQAEPTMAELAGDLLPPRLVECMGARHPGKEDLDEARFPTDRHPYVHQLAAWRHWLGDAGGSFVVAAGTGAGKTECFLVPVLAELARELEDSEARSLVGVRAIFLYPLNALIESQRARLSAWTRRFGGAIRYCLYNGETPERVPAEVADAEPERVASRDRLREAPPPILVTNATMLEYMLVRPEDAPILAASQGLLRTIVIDEAHTYLGSRAAELALLFRRVAVAFGVDPKRVRFVATSATLGGKRAHAELRQFLAGISGQEASEIRVFTHEHDVPAIDLSADPDGPLPPARDLEALSEAEAYARLAPHPRVRELRRRLVEEGPQPLGRVRQVLQVGDPGEALRVLDVLARARPSGEAPALLPSRVHFFARGLPGLRACLDRRCPGRTGALDDDAWPFGAVVMDPAEDCPHCGGALYELVACFQCGEVVARVDLRVEEEGGGLVERLRPLSSGRYGAETGFLDERADADLDAGEGEEDGAPEPDALHLLGAPDMPGAARVRVEPDERLGTDAGPEMGLVRLAGGEDGPCPRCGSRGSAQRGSVLRPLRASTEFALRAAVPAFLAEMPPGRSHRESRLPLGGRRLLAFTDSRQGAARFAAAAQGEAERAFVRSHVYHSLLALERAGDPERVAELRRRIAELGRLAGAGDVFARMLDETREELARLGQRRAVPVGDVAERLRASEDFELLLESRADYRPFRVDARARDRLALWLVLREFARRPARRASLETLGLVTVEYDGLDEAAQDPPPAWWSLYREPPERQRAVAEWRTWLKLVLDFFVRARSAVRIPDASGFFRWLGTDVRPLVLVPPGSEPASPRALAWPVLHAPRHRSARIAWLLARAFGLDPSDARQVGAANAALRATWEVLRGAEVLTAEADGFRLDLERLRLGVPEAVWRCPATGRLLDAALRGHSPYAPPPWSRISSQVGDRVPMPRPPEPFFSTLAPERRAERGREWLEQDEVAGAARATGILSEFAERVLVYTPYARILEHTAQVDSVRLRELERRFRRGAVNLLSCSTTMEMGIDIGALSGVAMNDVPPHPANFLQRVGRAGRRGEPVAVSLTLCRPFPHEQHVFRHPTWAFDHVVHPPKPQLGSRPIAERHADAWLLGIFLRDRIRIGSPLRITAGRFFLSPRDQDAIFPAVYGGDGGQRVPIRITGDAGRSLCDAFAGELRADSPLYRDRLGELAAVVRDTPLQGEPPERVLARARQRIDRLATVFMGLAHAHWAEYERLRREGHEPAARALAYQIRRLVADYLLSWLAERQFLPRYGFPAGILHLDLTTFEEMAARRWAPARASGEAEERPREDGRRRPDEGPSRDLASAIREYAPGQEVVVDGRVYRPAGLVRGWQFRGAGTEETGTLHHRHRYAECGHCGWADLRPWGEALDGHCPACGQRVRWRQVLEPLGFKVDPAVAPRVDDVPRRPAFRVTTRVSLGEQVAFEYRWPPSGEGAALLEATHSPDGRLIVVQWGHGAGFDVCLRCGRAVARRSDGERSRLLGHAVLRMPDADGSPPPRCGGGTPETFALQRGVGLGGRVLTDVLQVRLRGLDGAEETDERRLVTLGAALREAGARAIGVAADEIDFDVLRVAGGYRLLLYDTADGGAGFVAQVAERLPDVLDAACRFFDCPERCAAACPSCLLRADLQGWGARLDRHAWLDPDPREPLGDAWFAALGA